ncbi:PDR/VanB family oxidoreductase [Hydrogenophaga sp.]|uniref:PDR/VanB family oxidoreductase n=1 Tax=Hydrogenophaga sp. TaxID=1904254 RepID=UPI0027274C4C|nr:PDR/VanB family oxidoreductase [Hydrogenophaga sp.]MDO9435537.1 PDR/VanB family oxidoreductase [Hydrogenophaga sp.]
MNSKSRLQVRVHEIRPESDNVVSVELRAFENGQAATLPPFTPGSHIDLHLPIGIRSYSLTNSPAEAHRYVVAVGLPDASRGGSAYVHRDLKAGADLEISAPRNMFPLVDADGPVTLIAGGIGITPIRCMFNALREAGREVTLLYCARSRQTAAFADELGAQPGVTFHFDNEAGGPPDLDRLLASAPPSTHFYCCGPSPMLSAYEQAGARQSIATEHIHLERFSPAEDAPAVSKEDDGVFTVELARSGTAVQVLPGQSLLDALLDAGADASYSCREGICGACETTVIEGTPDHRDSVLSDAEKAASKTMMICVSRCTGKRLVLDL